MPPLTESATSADSAQVLAPAPATSAARPSLQATVTKLTIVIPAYNEERTIGEVIARVAAVDFPVAREVLVVDDGSRDGTRAVAERAAAAHAGVVRVLHKPNGGKGSAVRYGMTHATGDVVVVQDADLEIDPAECRQLLVPIMEHGVDAVYGSRFLGKPIEWTSGHLANRLLSLLTSLLFAQWLTDMETSHKMVRRHVLSGLVLTANRFDIEPEITGKLLRSGIRIHEVPIAYQPRTRAEGKKIGWRDGVEAVGTLWRVRTMPRADFRIDTPSLPVDADAESSARIG